MNRPEISRISPFESGEAVQIFGENLKNSSTVYWWRPEKGETRDEDTAGLPFSEALPELPPEDALKFKPSAVCERTIYLYSHLRVPGGNAIFWVETDGEISKPFLANKTVILNQSVKSAIPGDVVSFYGEGMWTRDYKRACLKSKQTGEFIMVPAIEVEQNSYLYDWHLYRTNISIPKDTPDGEYEVFVYSGYGGNFGWSEPCDLTVCSSYNITEYYRTSFNRNASREIGRPKCPIYSLPANILGVNYDITDELQALLDKAHESEEGAIVMLGAGTYAISRTLKLKRGAVLIGAGEGATTICAVDGCDFKIDWDEIKFAEASDQYSTQRNTWAVDWEVHWKRYNNMALIQIYEDAGINNLHLELGHGANMGVIIANDTPNAHSFGAFLNNISVDGGSAHAFWDKGFSGANFGIATVCSTTEMTVYNCRFDSTSPIHMLPAYHLRARVIRNIFKCASRQANESVMCGLHYCVVEQNDFCDGRRSMVSQNGFENNWIFMNKSSGVGRSRCGGEVYMSEYGATDWGGSAAKIGEDYIEVSIESGLFDPQHAEEVLSKETFYNRVMDMGIITPKTLIEYPRYLCILDGRGFGQYRKIKGVEGNRLYLDKPWDVMPDCDTKFTLVVASANNLWIDNDASLSGGHSEFVYGCGVDNIISGHQCYMAAGILNHAMGGYVAIKGTGVFCFNRVLHCDIRSSGKGITLRTSNHKCPTNPDYINKTCGVFGNTIAKCAFDGSRNLLYTKNQSDWSDPRPKSGIAIDGGYNIITDNHIGGYTVGIRLGAECLGNCLDGNVYEDIDAFITSPVFPVGNDLNKGNHYIR